MLFGDETCPRAIAGATNAKPGKLSLNCCKIKSSHPGTQRKGYWMENDAHKIIYIYIHNHIVVSCNVWNMIHPAEGLPLFAIIDINAWSSPRDSENVCLAYSQMLGVALEDSWRADMIRLQYNTHVQYHQRLFCAFSSSNWLKLSKHAFRGVREERSSYSQPGIDANNTSFPCKHALHSTLLYLVDSCCIYITLKIRDSRLHRRVCIYSRHIHVLSPEPQKVPTLFVSYMDIVSVHFLWISWGHTFLNPWTSMYIQICICKYALFRSI